MRRSTAQLTHLKFVSSIHLLVAERAVANVSFRGKKQLEACFCKKLGWYEQKHCKYSVCTSSYFRLWKEAIRTAGEHLNHFYTMFCLSTKIASPNLIATHQAQRALVNASISNEESFKNAAIRSRYFYDQSHTDSPLPHIYLDEAKGAPTWRTVRGSNVADYHACKSIHSKKSWITAQFVDPPKRHSQKCNALRDIYETISALPRITRNSDKSMLQDTKTFTNERLAFLAETTRNNKAPGERRRQTSLHMVPCYNSTELIAFNNSFTFFPFLEYFHNCVSDDPKHSIPVPYLIIQSLQSFRWTRGVLNHLGKKLQTWIRSRSLRIRPHREQRGSNRVHVKSGVSLDCHGSYKLQRFPNQWKIQ